MRLGLIALMIAIVVGIPLGVIAALKQNSLVDYVSLFIATIGISVPNFVMAIFLIIIFATWLHLVAVVPQRLEQTQAVDHAGGGAGLWHPGLHRPPDAHVDAGSDAAGLHPHGPRQGADRAGGHPAT